MDIQRIKAPDGSEMVILSAKDFEILREAAAVAGDAIDSALGKAALAEAHRDGFMPSAVVEAIIEGDHPVAAWRKHRRMSQADLGAAAGVTQAAIGRIEKADPGAGRKATREAIAKALGAPLWSIDGSTEPK